MGEADWEGLGDALGDADWGFLDISDVDSAVEQMANLIMASATVYIPTKRVQKRKQQHHWVNDRVLKLVDLICKAAGVMRVSMGFL